MPPPAWADGLTDRIVKDYGIKRPEVVWRRSRKWKNSSGHTALMGHRIVVTTGTDFNDQRDTLIHELAHAIQWQTTGDTNHDEAFWRLTFWMHERYSRTPWKRVLERNDRSATALRVASDLGIRGAKTAAQRRRGRN